MMRSTSQQTPIADTHVGPRDWGEWYKVLFSSVWGLAFYITLFLRFIKNS